jgi:pyrimidine operon attenuation protein/uracil phosphoribosyltransferase
MNTIVLVDRRHRRFPIKADWVGLTLSTTVQEHIRVNFKENQIMIYLE